MNKVVNEIFATEYGRTDGRVCAVKTANGWVLRSIWGPAHFWSYSRKIWISQLEGNFNIYNPEYNMTLMQALELLQTIEPVKY